MVDNFHALSCSLATFFVVTNLFALVPIVWRPLIYRKAIMRDKIKLVSTAGTGYYYTTTKNKRTMPGKMEIKKFDPKVRQHVIFKEAKIK